jgi:uncharacterized protein YlxW (UPF0749 family)
MPGKISQSHMRKYKLFFVFAILQLLFIKTHARQFNCQKYNRPTKNPSALLIFNLTSEQKKVQVKDTSRDAIQQNIAKYAYMGYSNTSNAHKAS